MDLNDTEPSTLHVTDVSIHEEFSNPANLETAGSVDRSSTFRFDQSAVSEKGRAHKRRTNESPVSNSAFSVWNGPSFY